MLDFERDGFRQGDIAGVNFDYYLQGGLDNCCGFYSVINAFCYLFARDHDQFLNNERFAEKEHRLLWLDDGFFLKSIMSHRLVREHLVKAYWDGAYPRDVEELAQFVNDEIFGGRYYSIKRTDDHGRLLTKTTNALSALHSHELHLVLIEEDNSDKIWHWIVLINELMPKPDSHRYVIDSNRRYSSWKLNRQKPKLVIRREKNAAFPMDGVDIPVTVNSAISIDSLPKTAARPSVL